ncbi:hypothetical protein ACXYMO_00915 [Arenibacterium sp. CAU 1754]
MTELVKSAVRLTSLMRAGSIGPKSAAQSKQEAEAAAATALREEYAVLFKNELRTALAEVRSVSRP